MRPYYDEGGITIYHGDCREILPSIARVNVVLTDPPYGIGFAAEPTKWQRRAGKLPESWDDVAPVDVVLALTYREARTIIWGGNYFALPPSRSWLSWYKPDAPPSMGSFELAWTNLDKNCRQLTCSISETNPERVGHPTQKPLRLMTWCLAQIGDPWCVGLVLDPFMGSGTTLRAAKDMGLRAIGIEIEERYCEIAAKRLAQGVLGL